VHQSGSRLAFSTSPLDSIRWVLHYKCTALREVPNGDRCRLSWEASLPVREFISGDLARIFEYMRAGGRCPAGEFLNDLESRMLKKFKGQFDALTKMGADYCNYERFKSLGGAGKPLWEFKEFDHRLYCHRRVTSSVTSVEIVLLNGWVKEKRGRTEKEDREITRAQSLYSEFLEEYPGGKL
jgi:hypothetical protein